MEPMAGRPAGSALRIKSLFILKVIPEVINPVVGSFQLGRINGQIRTT